jgi:DNA-binding NarL/FixJ family response regulator
MSLPTERTAVLVDEHPLWLDALEQVLARVDVTVVGKFTSPDDAFEFVERTPPELVVTAIEMADSDTDGIDLLRRVRERHPDIKGIVVSMYRDPEHIEAALDAGAAAYVVKTAHPDDVGSAIRQACDHSVFMAGIHRATISLSPLPAQQPLTLTRREVEILQLMAEGHSNGQLAKMLWVTEQTVKFHLSNIYRKLGVANRTEASRWAQRHGLLNAEIVAN